MESELHLSLLKSSNSNHLQKKMNPHTCGGYEKKLPQSKDTIHIMSA